MTLPLSQLCSTLLGALLVSSAASAQGGDTCANPTPLTAAGTFAFDTSLASTSGFASQSGCPGTVSEANQDLFWTFTVPANGHYLFNTYGSLFDTVLKVYDGGGCSATCLDANDNYLFLQSAVRLVELRAGQEILIQVGGYVSPFPGQPAEFGAGMLTIERFLDPCDGSLLPDYLEESDQCETALAIGDGYHSDLSISDIDSDFYALQLDPGATLDINVFVTTVAEITMILWDSQTLCQTSDWNQSIEITALAPFTTGIFMMSMSYRNTGASTADLVLQMHLSNRESCGPYDLEIIGSSGPVHPKPVGSPYCDAVPNSSGEIANLWALGSSNSADNDLRLVAASVPFQAFGFFLVSETAGFTANPVGSAGNLCLGGSIGRYVGPGQIQLSGPTGEIDLQLDLTNVPQPSGSITVAPGDSLFFQLWVRDSQNGTPTSNFSHGVEVTFS